jgi:FKBP-type peptidyl-prolyl cis-trans isomerase
VIVDATHLFTRGDTVLVHYSGWRQSTGETFFTTKGAGQPLTLDVDHVAPMFREALQRLHKGEKAVLWVPPDKGATEMLVYEVEVVDVLPAPVVADK